MQNQGSNAAPSTVEEFLECVVRWDRIDRQTAKGSQSLPLETETSSSWASSMVSSNPATRQASQNRNSECTAVPTNPENGEDTVPKTVNLATFEDRIAELEWRIEAQSTTISLILDRLERLEGKLRSCMVTSDKTLADRVQRLESESLRSMQNQMGIGSEAWTDLEAPSSIPPVQSAHCSEKLSTQNTDQTCAKTSSRRDIRWEEFDREYTAILATAREASKSKEARILVEEALSHLRWRLENLIDTK